jgi:YidC/Oxa1 family membrane protein insertase
MPKNLIEYLRIALYAMLLTVLLVLFQLWVKDHPQPITTTTTQPTTVTSSTNNAVSNTPNYLPQNISNQITSSDKAANTTTSDTQTAAPNKQLLHVKTNLLDVEIDPTGGNILQIKLLAYPVELHSTQPYELLNNSQATRYIAQSGLLSQTGPDNAKGQATYTSDATNYQLADGQNSLEVKLHWKNAAGVVFTKIYTFQRDRYEINVDYQIDNNSTTAWSGNLYLQLLRKNTPPVNKQGVMSFATYFGGAISSPEKPFHKISFKEMNNTNLDQTITGGWAAMVQHYFVSAWVPDKTMPLQYFTRVTQDGLYTLGMIGPKLTVTPGEKYSTSTRFYAGPAIADRLEKVAPGLLTIDYGWLWMISVVIFWLMQKIYNVIGNWGWSIVIVTMFIKLIFYHLSAKSYRSMSGLKRLQPQLATLKERFGGDKQKFTQATLELYKKEKVNPMSGCLPIIIQIPVFIALYWVLIESVQLRHAPFILWIHDLSTKDPYYVLPVLMGLSMFLQQRLNPPSADPTQAKVMMFMPIIFTAMFLNFPAGLMLYWFVNNTLSFLQQWYIMASMNKAESLKKDLAKKKFNR